MSRTQSRSKREWLSYREATDLVGLSRGTLHKLISGEEVLATKVGKAVRINKQSLEQWMLQHPYTELNRKGDIPVK